jgi:predicted GNAT superfamily acetyltransferase
VEIRKATRSDLGFLIEGLEENRRKEGRAESEVPARPEDYEAFETGFGKGWIRIAEDDHKPLGFLFYRTDFPVMYFRDPVFWIDLVFVKEEARGKGVGSALYEDAAALAKSSGIGKIVLDVFDNNEGSLAFHARMGFRRVYGIFEKPL